MRVKIIISYDGSKFEGFQVQKNGFGVANAIESALKSIGIVQKIVAAGRTDAGVHALNQVIHFDIPDYWQDLEYLKLQLNKKIFPFILIKKIQFVPDNFHSRFSATKRTYRFIITDKYLYPFYANYVTYVKKFDFNKAKQIIKIFEGEHDFEFFKKNGTQTKNCIRRIYKTKLYKYGDFYIFCFEGDGFLRSQVRLMVGAIVAYSADKICAKEIENQLNKNGIYYREPLPPSGLYLSKIFYK